MKNFCLKILAVIVFALCATTAFAYEFPDETLHYTITYKWGLIHKDAGKATLSLRNRGADLDMKLTARTLPWADKIFMVRDTLTSRMAKNGLKVKTYRKTSHEGKRYALDVIDFNHAGSAVKATTQRVRRNKDGAVTKNRISLTGGSPAFDMLSVFYYLRTLDFNGMSKGKIHKVAIFSGKKVETMTIKVVGKETLTMRDKTKREAWKLTFSFSTPGKKISSDNIEAWISTKAPHIPLYLVGKLHIGQVRVYLDK